MGRQSRLNPFAGKRPQDPIIPTACYDRLGRQLHAGDIVHILGKHDVFWQIMQVGPNLNPGVPAGAMQVTFAATFQPTVPGGQRLMDVLTVEVAEEPAPQRAEGEGQQHADGEALAEAEAIGTETPLPSGPRRIE